MIQFAKIYKKQTLNYPNRSVQICRFVRGGPACGQHVQVRGRVRGRLPTVRPSAQARQRPVPQVPQVIRSWMKKFSIFFCLAKAHLLDFFKESLRIVRILIIFNFKTLNVLLQWFLYKLFNQTRKLLCKENILLSLILCYSIYYLFKKCVVTKFQFYSQ